MVDGHQQVAPHPNAILNNMDDQEQQRSQAILTFLGAGLQQPPHRAPAVTALANARRGLAAHRASNQPVDTWLTEQVRHGGIRENAATLAVLALPEHHQQTAQACADRHPDRITALHQLIDAIS